MPTKGSLPLRSRPLLSAALIVCCACLLSFALAACGGGGSSTSSESTGSTEASGGGTEETGKEGGEEAGGALAQVAEEVAEHEEEPAEIPQAGHPMKTPPPKGKKIVYVDCGVQACTEINEGVAAAAKALGWNYKRIKGGATPSEITSAWNQAVAEKPDFVVASGVPTEVFKTQLAELEANGAVFQNIQAVEPQNTPGNALGEQTGNWEAQWLAVKSNCDANVNFVTVPEFPIVGIYGDGLKTELEKLCPEAGFKETKVTVAELGKQLPSQMVSILQKEPDTNFLVMGFGDMTIGVPEALQAAHLDPDIITTTLSSAVLQYIKEGKVAMGIAQPQQPAGWIVTEGVIRKANGEPFFKEQELAPEQILTEANVPENVEEQYNFPATFEEQYEELWGLK